MNSPIHTPRFQPFARRGRWALVTVFCAAILAPPAFAAEPVVPFVTGEGLRRTLAEPIGVSWSGRTFRDALESISRNTHVSIVLDRRVDPNRSVEWSAPALPVGRLIEELAALHDCGIAWIGPTAYVTSRPNVGGIAQNLADRNAEFPGLPDDLRTAVAARRTLSWSDLAEPRSVLESLAGEANVRWTNPDAVPFDALYHIATPPLSLVERLTLVGAGFGLTYRIDASARTISLVPIGDEPAPSSTGTKPTTIVEPPRTSSGKASPAMQVHTLKVENVPLSRLVAVLRDKHGLKIRFDDAALAVAGLTTDRHTSVDVKQATLEALLEQAAAPLGMTAYRDGDTIVIGPRK